MSVSLVKFVIPAKAGIHFKQCYIASHMDFGLRQNDNIGLTYCQCDDNETNNTFEAINIAIYLDSNAR